MEKEVLVSREGDDMQGSYVMPVPGSDRPAVLTWSARQQGDTTVRIAEHTFTPPQARGKGIAMELVQSLVADAREQGFTIDPRCSYVAAKFRENPDWSDLRAR